MTISTKTIEQLTSNGRSTLNNRDSNLLKEFSELLSRNLNTSRSVKYYANLLAITTKKLNSITKTYWGITAKKFIEEKIIHESKKILLETPDTIKQISYTLGFTEPTNFNKFFKKFTDTTPLQFRQQYYKGTF